MLKKRRKQSDPKKAEKIGPTEPVEPKPATKTEASPVTARSTSPDERRRMIAEAAYYRAQRRGFAPGGELEDWVHAEAEIDRLIQSVSSVSSRSVNGAYFNLPDQSPRDAEAPRYR
jgi:hypothetical protein